MKRIISIILSVIVTVALILLAPMLYNSITNSLSSNSNAKPDIIDHAKAYANHCDLQKSNDHITVYLDDILATNHSMYFWIRVDGIRADKILDSINECTVIDSQANIYTYSLQEEKISEYGSYSIQKPTYKIDGVQSNELILKFISGMPSDSAISVDFDFGEFGEIAFDDIDVKLAVSTVYVPDQDTACSFDLPYAHCEILKAEYSPLGVFFTIRWELQSGFSESTKTEYSNYHTKFTFGDSSRSTFLLMPDHWTDDEAVVISTYHLPEIVLENQSIIIDLYLNDDTTFVRNLATLAVESDLG